MTFRTKNTVRLAPGGGPVLLLLTGLLLAAFWLRVQGLATIPPGISFDAASNLADALRLHQGLPLSVYFGTRPEPLYRFVLAGWYALTGTHLVTANLLQGYIGLVSVALAYRAGARLWRGPRGQALSGVVAALALSLSLSHVALSRITERGVLLPLALLLALILLLRALHRGRWRGLALAGAAAAGAVYTYTAGLIAVPWLAGVALWGAWLRVGGRLRWQQVAALAGGALLCLLPWLALNLAVPTLYYRVGQASDAVAALSLPERALRGLPLIGAAYASGSDAGMFYNLPFTPPLPLPFTLLALVGLARALWRWRHADGALLAGSLLLSLLPALFSNEPQSSIRLSATTVLVALLAGSGAAALLVRLPLRPVLVGLALAAGAGTLATGHTYRAFWQDDERYTAAPATPQGIPYHYTLALHETLERLTQLQQPACVPLRAVNSALAYYVLQRAAYPHVTTWARAGLTEIPACQVIYPTYDYFHLEAAPQEPLQVLLLPAEKTMVILPPAVGGERVIRRPQQGYTRWLSERYGWELARVSDRPAQPLPAWAVPEAVPVFGTGLELVNPPEVFEMAPGTLRDTVLLWRVNAAQPADLAARLQVIDTTLNAIAHQEDIVLEYLYPSARWQPGDIVPDPHTIRLPDTIPPGLYRWGAGAYITPFQQSPQPVHKPPVLNHPGALWLWGLGRSGPAPAPVALPPDLLPVPDHAFAAGVRLRGAVVQPGANTWQVRLYWQALRQPETDLTLFVHALDAAGGLAGQDDRLPNNGLSPLWSWRPGEIIETTHTLPLTTDPVILKAGFYNPLTQVRVAVSQAGATVPEAALTFWKKESPTKEQAP